MKIDASGFGFRVPQDGGRVDVPAQAFVQQGLTDLGAAGQKIAAEVSQSEQQDAQIAAAEEHRKRLEAEAETKQLAREAKRAEAMTVSARAQNSLADEHDRIYNGVRDGTIGVDAAPKLWQESSAKIVDEHLKTVDRANEELVRSSLVRDVGRFGRNINAGVTARNREQIGASLNDTLEELQRLAVTDLATAKKQGVMAIESQGPLAGYNAEQVSKMRHAFIEGATFNTVNTMLIKAKDNRAALDRFVKALPEMPDLDPTKRNVLLNQATSQIQHLENKAIAAENRRVAKLGIEGRKIETAIASGINVEPATLVNFEQAAKGTPYEEYATGLIEEQRAVSTILAKPPIEQVNFLNEQHRLMLDGKVKPSVYARLERTVKGTVKMLGDAPLQYAAVRGGAQIEPLDVMKPESWTANLAHRTEVLTGQNLQTKGASGMAGLLPQEAQALTGYLKTAQPKDQARMFGQLWQGFGSSAVYRATMQQIAKDDPVLAKSGIMAARGFENDQHRPVAEMMLAGERILRQDKKEDGEPGKGKIWPMPKGEEMEREFSAFAKGAYLDEKVRNVDFQGARALYAKMAVDAGDDSGVLNAKRWKSAMELSTGGVEKWQGRAIVMPYRMNYGDFKDGLRARIDAAVDSGAVDKTTAGRLYGLPLENAGDGKYVFRAGDSLVVDANGRPVVVDFNVSAPFVPSGDKRRERPTPATIGRSSGR